MRKLLLLSLAILAFKFSFAQETPFLKADAVSVFYTGEILGNNFSESPDAAAQAYLKNKMPHLSEARCSLKLMSSIASEYALHLDYIQTFNGVEIFGTDIKINIHKNGKILSCFSKTINTENWKRTEQAEEIHMSFVPAGYIIQKKKNCIWVDENYLPVSAIEVEVSKLQNIDKKLYVVDADEKLLFSKSVSLYFGKGKDTVVKAKVFLPDPLTTAGKTYGGNYRDFSDSAVAELDAERKDVNMVVQYQKTKNNTDSFYLESRYVKMTNLDAPNYPPVTSSSPVFIYSRHEHGFEDINVFYHLGEWRKRMKFLGYEKLDTTQMLTDAQGGTGENSQFTQPNTLYFGTGGVDDGEDADVMIHEYTHSVTYAAAPNSDWGTQRLVIEEGICDYFACGYSKALNAYHWDYLYNWDGHNQFWSGRSCVTTKKYAKNKSWSTWDDADLWAGTIMEIQDDVGRDTADKLMFYTLYSLAKYQNMPDVARLFLQSDSLLYGGKHSYHIAQIFINHNILDSATTIKEVNNKNEPKIVSRYFAEDGLLYVKLTNNQSGKFSLYDVQGRLVDEVIFMNNNTINLYNPSLVRGVYYYKLMSGENYSSGKLFKAR